jgi:GR25 family glycosyltransferase involved in LPS biosynthesis
MSSKMHRWSRSIANRRFGPALADYFNKIYCINLDDRKDRWSYVSRHLAGFGLKNRVERFSAVDVRHDPQLQKHEKLINGNFSLLAMCGCMLSHRKIIEMAKREHLRNVLVLEDDIEILSANIRQIRRTLFDLSKHDWDVFYLGATYLWRLHAISPYLVNVANGAYATHAIAYNHSIFDRILELLPSDPKGYFLVDRFEVNALDKWLQSDSLDHRKFFGANPIMVVQGLQESDIAQKQKDAIAQKQIDLFSQNLNP